MREKLMNEIRAHVAEQYPSEACGLVVQTGTSQIFFRCRNVADNPGDNFTVSPDDYLAASSLGEIIMVVHSHPDVVQLIPSELDRIQCDHSGIEWGIMSWPDGDFCTLSPRGDRELAGRRWVLGHADCWSLIMDYYRIEHGITVKNYSVEREWWVNGDENLYDDNWQAEGFVEVDPASMQVGDMVMMQVQSSVTNHAAIYLGDNIILHHLAGNLSSRVPYGKYYRDRTVRVVRRKELMNDQDHDA